MQKTDFHVLELFCRASHVRDSMHKITSLELLRTLMLCLVQLSKRRESKATHADKLLSLSRELRTASSRGRYGERRQRDPCLKHTYKNTTCWPATAYDVTTGVNHSIKGRQENTSSSSSSSMTVLFEACFLLVRTIFYCYYGEH